MPKNKQRNPYYFYAVELQREHLSRGNHISMKEACNLAAESWKSLLPQDKYKYEDMARSHKLNRDGSERKYTSDGQLISVAEWKDSEPARRQEKMARDVKTYVSQLQFPDGLLREKIYIISFNIAVQTYEEEVFPNEIGIAEYSIEEGLQHSYHKFIDTGPLPSGYASAAKAHSEQYHEIPLYNFSAADKNYGGIYFDVKRFINPSVQGNGVHVFCKSEQLEQIEGCLKWLHQKAGNHGQRVPIVVWDLTLLLMELCAAADRPFASKTFASDKLGSSAFDYISGIRCGYHEEKDNGHCALGVARSLCYMLSDVLCAAFGVECTDKHLPSRTGGVHYHSFEPNLSNIKPAVNKIVVNPKPVTQHQVTTIVPAKSKFIEEDDVVITPSALTSPAPSSHSLTKTSTSFIPGYVGAAAGQNVAQVPELEDEEEFPALGGHEYSSGRVTSPSQNESVAEQQRPNMPSEVSRQPRSLPQFFGRGLNFLTMQQQLQHGRGIGRGANMQPRAN